MKLAMLRHLLRPLVPAMLAATVLAAPAMAYASPEEPTLAETVAQSSLSGSYLAAQIATKDNDDEAAVAFYERAVKLDPENADLKQLLFLSLTANGRIGEAVEIGRTLPQGGNQGGVVRLVIAVDALRQRSWSKVGDMLKERASGDLDRLVEELLLAWADFGAGKTDKALAAARSIDGPDWAKVVSYYHGGLIAAAGGNDAEAEKLLLAATENEAAAAVLSETYLRAIEALVRAQSRLGKTEEARQTLDKGMRLLSSHPPFAALKRQLDEGKPLGLLVTSAQQGGSELFFNVGAAVARQGGSTLAQGYLQLADFLNPGNDVVVMTLASVFEKQKNHARANSYYQRIDAKSAYWRRARLEYALNLNDLKQVDDSVTTLRALIDEQPDDLIAYSTLGGVLSQHERYREAAEVYDKAVATIGQPEALHWNLFYRRGIAYERLKEWAKAEPNFKQALELSPNQADVANYLGYSWIDMGINLDEGMELIRKAVDLKPRSGFIVDSLGWAYYRLGKYDDAVRELERAVELMPQDAVVNDHLGDAYWKVGRKLEATFQWNHALAAKPEPEEEAKIRMKLEKGLVENGPSTAATE